MAEQSDTRTKGPALRESKPHPDKGRPSTSTGEATRATDAGTGLGSDDKPVKSQALRMVIYAVLAVVVILILVGFFA